MKVAVAAFLSALLFIQRVILVATFDAGNRRTFIRSTTAAATAGSAAAAAFVATTVGSTFEAFAAGPVSNRPKFPKPDSNGFVTSASGLRYKIITEGKGEPPPVGSVAKTHYTGWLDGFDSEKKFGSSRDINSPFTCRVGCGLVIRGLEETFGTMLVGERRRIIVPPNLGYGDRGSGGIIPGGATLYFDVELLDIFKARGIVKPQPRE